MTETWARDLHRVLVDAGRHVVRQVQQRQRQPLDAFCIVVDSGSCWIAWDEAPPAWRPGQPLPPRDTRLPGDFTEPNADVPAEVRDALVDAGDTYAARYEAAEQDGRSEHAEEQLDAGIEAAAAAALADLGPELALVDRTPGFVAHVIRFDGQWLEESVRRTLSDDLVAWRFPGFEAAHRREVELGGLSTAGGPEALVARLAQLYQVPAGQRVDVDMVAAVDRELRGNAEAAIPPVLDLLEDQARRRQFTDPGSEACHHLGMWTRAHRLTAHLLLHVLPRLWHVRQPAVEQRLVDLGRWLHDNPDRCREPGREEVMGLNESLVARTLHALWPDRYPAVDVAHTTNQVTNAAAYGFTTLDQA